MSVRLGHIGLTVSNLDRSVYFYQSLFGFVPFFRVRRGPYTSWLSAAVGYPGTDIEFCHLRGTDGLHLELLKYHWPTGMGLSSSFSSYCTGHMHFTLVIDSGIEDLTEEIAVYIREVARNDAGNSTRFFGHADDLDSTMITDGPQKGGKGYYLRDPDNHTVEIWQPATGVKFGQPASPDEVVVRP